MGNFDCDDLCACLNKGFYRSDESFKFMLLKTLCDILTNGLPVFVVPGAAGNAVFSTQSVTLAAAITNAYVVVADLPDDTKSFSIANETNKPLQLSMDGGVTDTYLIEPGQEYKRDLLNIGLVTTAAIAVKYTASGAPTAGSLKVYSVK